MKRNDYRGCRKNTGRHNHNRRRNDNYDCEYDDKFYRRNSSCNRRDYDEKLYRKYGIIF